MIRGILSFSLFFISSLIQANESMQLPDVQTLNQSLRTIGLSHFNRQTNLAANMAEKIVTVSGLKDAVEDHIEQYFKDLASTLSQIHLITIREIIRDKKYSIYAELLHNNPEGLLECFDTEIEM